MKWCGTKIGFVILVGLCVSCGEDSGTEVVPTQAALGTPGGTGTAASSAEAERASSDRASDAVTSVDRGPFFGWLPRDTLLAFRAPHLDQLREAWSQTMFVKGLEQLDLGFLEEKLGSGMDFASTGMQELLGVDCDVPTLAACFSGDIVFAVIDVNPALMMGSGNVMPFGVVGFAELSGAPLVRQVVKALAEKNGGKRSYEGDADREVYLFQQPEFSMEVVISEDTLAVSVGPPSSQHSIADLSKTPVNESFLASSLVRAMPAYPEGATPCFEFLLSLEAVWDAVNTLAPVEAKQVVRAMHLEQLQGLSFVSSIRDGKFEEVSWLHSNGGQDLISRLMGKGEVEEDFVRWVPGDANQAALFAMDLAHAAREIREALPADARLQYDNGLQGVEMMTGVNVRTDIFENFGPQFVFASRGNMGLTNAETGLDFEVLFGIEIQDQGKAKKLIDLFLNTSGMASARRAQKAAGKTYYTMDVPVPMATGMPVQPSYALTDNCLLFGSTSAVVRKALMASEAKGSLAPQALRESVEDLADGTWFVSYNDVEFQVNSLYQAATTIVDSVPELQEVELPSQESVSQFATTLTDEITRGYRGPKGLWTESHSAGGVFFGVFANAAGPISGSVLVPNLMSARLSANESAAIATLRGIASSQRQFRDKKHVDLDGDGYGEYGYLAELIGSRPPRGRKETIQSLLPPSFGPVENGVVVRSGYVFRVDLPDPQGIPVGEGTHGGPARPVGSEGAENGWVAYCWPLEYGSTGSRAFVIDESGALFATTNDHPNQQYSGLQSFPRGDAAFLSPGNNRDKGTRSVRRGRDGALWMKEDL